MTNIIGIDPGKNGGISVLSGDRRILALVKMPDTPTDLIEFLSGFKPAICYIENVHSMPTDGAKAAFAFGYEVGKLHTALSACEIPAILVSPQTWMKSFSLKREKMEPHASYKRRLKAKAQQLFPSAKITLYNCDAALISEYGRQKEICV